MDKNMDMGRVEKEKFIVKQEMLVSIIVPVYNVEKVLERCLDSVKSQTYQMIEVLLIDDGSTDNSGKICDRYAAADQRFKVYHLKNSGVSNARNFGLENFNGEYLTFVDSDDVVSKYLIEHLLMAAIESGTLLATCHSINFRYDTDIKIEEAVDTKIKQIKLKDYRYTNYEAHFVAWGVLYHRSFVREIRFCTDLFVGEDTFFFAEVINLAGIVVDVDEPLYYHIVYNVSLSQGCFDDKKYTEIITWKRICDLFKNIDGLYESCRVALSLRCVLGIKRALNDRVLNIKLYENMFQTLMENYNYFISSNIRIKDKGVGTLFCIFNKLFKIYYLFKQSRNLKTACIITIYDPVPNYGNRLQNYAVEQVLKYLGLKVITLTFEKNMLDLKMKIKYVTNRLSGYRLGKRKFFWKYDVPKLYKFNCFNCRYLNPHHISSNEDLVVTNADYFILGSDQVWNPDFFKYGIMRESLFLLKDVKIEKKVCFSPSFGVDNLAKEWELVFQKYLQLIPHISVREEAGAKIVKNLTGKKAAVLIDPTMMLDADEWTKIAKPPKGINLEIPYILTYFIGDVGKRVEEDLGKWTGKYNLNVYKLNDKSQQKIYVSGPREFISLISKAELIMTDSFHACVFSFLFKKPFLVYSREGNESSMMSRMETFLKKFDLERKYVDSGLENDLFECEYSTGFERLNIERQKALSFLKRSMGMQEQTE